MPNDVALDEVDVLAALWDDDVRFEQLAQEAVQDALQEHKRKGQSVVVWQDGKIVTLTADEIPEAPVRTPPSHG